MNKRILLRSFDMDNCRSTQNTNSSDCVRLLNQNTMVSAIPLTTETVGFLREGLW